MMTPIFLNPPTSNTSFPFMELQEECDHHSSLQLFLAPPHNNNNNQSSSSSLCSTLFTKSPPPDDQFARRNPSSDDPSNHNAHNKVYDEYATHGESSDHNSHHQVDSDHQYYNKVSSAKKQDEVGENVRNGNGSMKWMSSKVRLMRKMIQSDHKAPSWRIELKTHHDHYQQPESSEMVVVENNNGRDIIRVCSNCNTTKTPLWRSGPQGPKSLCNACGIRQRKARRAMEAAAAAGGATVDTGGGEGSSSSTSVKSTLKLVTKKKKARSSHYNLAEHNKKSAHHHKQRFDQVKESFVDESNEKNHWFEEFAKNLLMKNSSFQRMFTQDEEEGAVLLMALSYGHGLVQG